MEYKLHTINGTDIVELTGDQIIDGGSSFLQTAMNLPSENIIVHKEQLPASFFELRSGTAGDILQKVVNYHLRVAIVGDFSMYESKSLKDFIYESNRSKSVNFVNTVDVALEKLQG